MNGMTSGRLPGATLVELGKHLYGTDSVSEVLACIETARRNQ